LFLVCFIAIISTSNLLISFITSIHFMLVPCTFYVAILIFRFLCLVRLEFFLPKFRKFWSGICSIKDFLRVLGCWPNNPTPIWSTRVFLFVRHLSFDLCGKGDPTSSYATAAQLSGSPVYASFSTRHRGNTFREDLCPETLNFEKQDGLTQLSVWYVFITKATCRLEAILSHISMKIVRFAWQKYFRVCLHLIANTVCN
jgi:hypothetical protein